MTEIISSNKTIAKNTLFLYARMLFNLVVSLYTSRIILDVLGVTDLGVFQVVAGIITIFTFFNSGLAGATSRFLAFEIGQGNKARLQRTFSSAVNAYIFFSFSLILRRNYRVVVCFEQIGYTGRAEGCCANHLSMFNCYDSYNIASSAV